MHIHQERRSGDDRREFAVYYPHGSERRDNGERRTPATAEGDRPPDAGRELWQEYWGAADESASSE